MTSSTEARDGDVYIWRNGNDRDDYSDTGITGTDIIRSTVGTFQGLQSTFNAATDGIEQIERDGGGPLTIRGTSGADIWDFSGATLVNATIDARQGADHVIGTDFADTIRGHNGNDILEGRGGADTILLGRTSPTRSWAGRAPTP